MVIRCPYPDITIPEEDILTHVFGSGEDLSDDPLWINAADDTQYLSTRTALQWVKRLAVGLDRLGVKEGDVVMTITPNHIFVPIAYLGIAGSCRIFSGANPAYSADEISYQIQKTGAKVVLVHPTLLGTARRAAKTSGLSDDRLFLFSDVKQKPKEGVRDWRSMLASNDDARSYRWPHLTGSKAKSQVATLNFSSGTTGLPKGVKITHYNLVANACQCIHLSDLKKDDQEDVKERWIGMLPLFHAFGQLNSILLAVKLQTPVYIISAFVYEDMLQVIQKYRVTECHIAPPIAVLLTKHPATAKYDLSSIRRISCGAAPLSQSLANECSARLDTSVKQGWGMTELTCAGIFLPHGFHDDTGSIGFLCPNCEVMLVDENGKEVATGERGEILIRGPNVSLGYWENEKATKETMLKGGWLKTGDIAVSDERGWFWIVDRLKELIKVSGYQVAPAELEALLLTHPAIADAGVIGIQDSFDSQEKPRAYVQLHKKNGATAEEIQRWVQGKVAEYKRLTGGVVFIDAVPKSAAGKIQRKVMKEWAKTDTRTGRAKL